MYICSSTSCPFDKRRSHLVDPLFPVQINGWVCRPAPVPAFGWLIPLGPQVVGDTLTHRAAVVKSRLAHTSGVSARQPVTTRDSKGKIKRKRGSGGGVKGIDGKVDKDEKLEQGKKTKGGNEMRTVSKRFLGRVRLRVGR